MWKKNAIVRKKIRIFLPVTSTKKKVQITVEDFYDLFMEKRELMKQKTAYRNKWPDGF